jgi:hypothetical protein
MTDSVVTQPAKKTAYIARAHNDFMLPPCIASTPNAQHQGRAAPPLGVPCMLMLGSAVFTDRISIPPVTKIELHIR